MRLVYPAQKKSLLSAIGDAITALSAAVLGSDKPVGQRRLARPSLATSSNDAGDSPNGARASGPTLRQQPLNPALRADAFLAAQARRRLVRRAVDKVFYRAGEAALG